MTKREAGMTNREVVDVTRGEVVEVTRGGLSR
jgi:hypothetical protein